MMRGFGYYYNMMGGYGWTAWLGMFFFGLLLLIAIVLLVIWAIRTLSHTGHHPSEQSQQMHGWVDRPAPPFIGPSEYGHYPGQQGQPGQQSAPQGQQHGQQMHPGQPYPGATGGPHARSHDEAVEIVRRRYAAGELTREQYDDMMRNLGR
jgi:uncharacterized membrane protein